MPDFDRNLDASKLSFDGVNYKTRFKNLLVEIYSCYKLMIEDRVYVLNNENKIRDILVDDYLSSNIDNYEFKKEEDNHLGRVDIYIVNNFLDTKPHFIIECKRLDNKNINGKDGLNGKYIINGIQRFLTEHYYLENNFNINAMLGFIVEKIDISSNISALNELSNKMFKNLVEIKQPIILEQEYIYHSSYQTGKPEKDFFIYHLMMDFSNNIK